MYKMIKRTKPCHCRYKPHTPHDMSLFVMYSCRVPFDNDRQWSCYIMLSNRFVHVKWGKSDNFWLKREREMIPTTSTHCENRWTERTDGRSAPGGASLAAFHVWGVLFNWFPTFHFFIPLKNASFLTLFFIPFQRACFLPCFNHCSKCDRFQPGFRHCSCITPVFLCPRLVSQRPV